MELSTISDLAKRLRLHQSTIRALARSGAIAVVRISKRSIRFREEDIQAFIESMMKKIDG